ncbi:hypothetical protein [Hyphomicrobium sp.]|uniref:hypothetical protein n=1 Tax=Hyphomicrobium sp. TaxID=82 RepID=UPI0025B96699|nr:hypothetical protein [Hyphomicrobium sp.]MCC7250669.1 hypothetical protein [Hyphomicrobium sp.]
MRVVHLLLLLCLSISDLAIDGAAAGDIYSPPKGTPLRAQLLDAARPTFEREVGAPVEFVVETLNVMDGWAYDNVKLQRPGGVPIDWRSTKFAEDFAQGMRETESNLFLLQQGGDGWTLVEYAIGPTDVAWDWWRQQRNLPYELFGATAEDFGAPPASVKPRSGG